VSRQHEEERNVARADPIARITPPGPLTSRLAELDEAVSVAAARRYEASARRRARERVRVGVEATRPLRDYVEAVHFRKREADEDEHRRICRELLARIAEEGLLLDVDGRGRLRILDPTVETEEADANARLVSARQARERFLAENAEGLAEERRAAESQMLKDAVAAGDAAAVRSLLDAAGAPRSNTLTTADLPV
jgi:hypothetical protein